MDDRTFSLKNPENLQLADEQGNICYGCDQEWFLSFWQRMAGCGPCVATNILLYLNKAKNLHLPVEVAGKQDFIRLMDIVWKYVTPSVKGIYLLSQLCTGMEDFSDVYGNDLDAETLNVPQSKDKRPNLTAIVDFIAQGLLSDTPVAFLNLSNGAVNNLDKWHWVTIVSLQVNSGGILLTAYDAAKTLTLDLRLWYETSTLGGGFVYFKEHKAHSV